MANRPLPPALASAHRLWEKGQRDDAIRKFNEAVRQAPQDVRVLIEASRALGLRYQIDRSVGLLERALKLAARRPEVQHAAGDAYRVIGRMAEAEACYRRACRLTAAPLSQLELAKLLERRHQLDDAESLVTSVLRAAPRLGHALMLRGRLERRRGEYAKAESTLQQAIAGAAGEPKLAAEALGELAAVFDAAGQFDDAWAAIVRSKQLQMPASEAAWSTIQFVLRRCRQMVEELTPAHVARWQASAPELREQRVALLTGFPRTGTTLLEQALDAHPDIVAAEEKEIFSAEIFPSLGEGRPADAPIVAMLEELPSERRAIARDQYLELMQQALGEPIAGRLLLDKNPAMNMMIPPIRRLFPNLKLIIALRDPRDVVLSCFLRYLPINPVSACYLTIERTAERYAFEMQTWLGWRETFGDWIEVRYEDSVADLRGQVARVLESLELPWDDSVMSYRERLRSKPVLSPTYEAVAQPVHAGACGRWRHYEKHLAPVLERLSPVIAALGYEA